MCVSELALLYLELFKMIILVSQSSSFDDLSKDWVCVCMPSVPPIGMGWSLCSIMTIFASTLYSDDAKQMEIIFLTSSSNYIFPRLPRGERGMGVRNRFIAAFGTPPFLCSAFLLTIICPSPLIFVVYILPCFLLILTFSFVWLYFLKSFLYFYFICVNFCLHIGAGNQT